MSKKCVFTVLCFVLTAFNISAQTITGKVTNVKNEPLEYLQITLFSNEKVPLKNELTNEKGEFNLSYTSGNYKLQVIEFNTVLYSKDIVLNKNIDLGTIQIDDAQLLDEVTISSRKKIVERKIDRLVFNVENTIASAGGNALDALRITPSLSVQNDNVTMIGRGNPRVLIDGKLINLQGEDLSNLLQTIPSDNIKSIEVITTPPAKYEAIGSSGLINITLKKGKNNTQSTTIGSGYLRRAAHDEWAINGNFLYNKDKLSLSSSLNYRDGGQLLIFKDRISYPTEFWKSDNEYERDYKRLNAMFNIDYEVTPIWTVGLQYLGNFNTIKGTRESSMNANDYGSADIKRKSLADSYVTQDPTRFNSVNLFNEFKLDTLGKKLNLNLDYFDYLVNENRSYNGVSTVVNPQSVEVFQGKNNSINNIKNFSAKLDFELPTKAINWSFGGKVSLSKTENSRGAFNSGLVTNPITNFTLTKSNFTYDENVFAGYFSGNKKFSEKLNLQFGLRLEATQTESFDSATNKSHKNDYTKLFPSVNLAYSPNDNSTFRFGYNRRVQRPDFNELNSNISNVNAFLSIQGNPVLQPSFIGNFEVSYQYKKIETKLYYTSEKNQFNQIGSPDNDNFSVHLIMKNLYDINRYGASQSYIFDTFKWWTSNNSLSVNYFNTTTFDDVLADGLNGFFTMFTSNNDFILNSDKTALINLNFFYRPKGVYGISKLDPSSSTAVTFQYLMLDKNLKLSLKANDIFRVNKQLFGSTVDGVYRYGDYYYDHRHIQFSVSYKFGNKKLNMNKRSTGNEEERGRANN